jgi:hypothetical protein
MLKKKCRAAAHQNIKSVGQEVGEHTPVPDDKKMSSGTGIWCKRPNLVI